MFTEFINPTRSALAFSRNQIMVYVVWSTTIVCTFTLLDWTLLSIPFLPVSLIGTALAFFLGFKSNASYERLYEGRKNYGSIVNDSRSFATMLNTYISNLHDNSITKEAIFKVKTDLINRHIAWMYAHKFYLRHKRQPWEPNRNYHNATRESMYSSFNIHTDLAESLAPFLSKEELEQVLSCANPATQLLNNQGKKS